jgi:hypothetical protein
MVTIRSIEGSVFDGGLGRSRDLNTPDRAVPALAHEGLAARLAAIMAMFA